MEKCRDRNISVLAKLGEKPKDRELIRASKSNELSPQQVYEHYFQHQTNEKSILLSNIDQLKRYDIAFRKNAKRVKTDDGSELAPEEKHIKSHTLVMNEMAKYARGLRLLKKAK